MTSILPPENTAFDTGYALSPDGTRLVFSARSVEGKLSLWLRHLDSLVTQELSNTDGATFPFWSPDSQWIAFFAGGKLRKIPAVGGDVQSICDAPTFGRGGSWNSHGVIVFAPSALGPLFRVSANGGTPTQVTQLDSSTGETTHRYPSFLPDGEHFLYLARQTSESKPHDVYVGSLNSTTRTKVLRETSDAKYVAPGYLLFLNKSTLYAQRFDAQTLRITGEAAPLAPMSLVSSVLSGPEWTTPQRANWSTVATVVQLTLNSSSWTLRARSSRPSQQKTSDKSSMEWLTGAEVKEKPFQLRALAQTPNTSGL